MNDELKIALRVQEIINSVSYEQIDKNINQLLLEEQTEKIKADIQLFRDFKEWKQIFDGERKKF